MVRNLSARLQTLFVLVGLVVLFGIASPHFLTTDNLLNVMQQSAINAILGIGLTFVIISGGIDLSVGSILALCGLVTADLLVTGSSMPVAILGGVAVGVLCGLVSGVVTTLGRIPPFISTLGMMLVARSAAKIYSDSKPISGLPESFRALSGDIFGIPVLVIVVGVLYVIAHLVLTRTKLGRYAYAIGGNEQAAWLSGVPVGRYKIAIYGLSGLMAGVAAVLMTSRLNAASPLTGEMYELYAIAAAVIGGVSLMGGEGRIVGTLIGALIMGTLRNGLNALNVPSALEGMVVGAVLVAAVVLDRARHRGEVKTAVTGWRRLRKLIVVGMMAVVLVAGAIGIRVRAAAQEENETVTVAFVPKALNSPFWGQMQEAGEKEAAALGVKLVSLAADRETDVERQYQIIENLIQQGVDAILLAPVGVRKSSCRRSARPTMRGSRCCSSTPESTLRPRPRWAHEVLTYIGSDNYEGGAVAGRYLAAELGGSGRSPSSRGSRVTKPPTNAASGFSPGSRVPRGFGSWRARPPTGSGREPIPWPRTCSRPTPISPRSLPPTTRWPSAPSRPSMPPAGWTRSSSSVSTRSRMRSTISGRAGCSVRSPSSRARWAGSASNTRWTSCGRGRRRRLKS